AGFGQRFGPPMVPAGKQRKTDKNLFGTEFPWAAAEVTVNGERVDKAEIRYSGGITYLSSAFGVKRPLRIALGDWRGLSNLELQSMPLDPSKSRQVLASDMFRLMGVP